MNGTRTTQAVVMDSNLDDMRKILGVGDCLETTALVLANLIEAVRILNHRIEELELKRPTLTQPQE